MSEEKNKTEHKSPLEYEMIMGDLFRRIYKCFSLEGKPMECEKELMKTLDNLYCSYNHTKNDIDKMEYRRVFREYWKMYNQLINKKLPKDNNLIRLEDIESPSNYLYPEEIEESIGTTIWKDTVE